MLCLACRATSLIHVTFKAVSPALALPSQFGIKQRTGTSLKSGRLHNAAATACSRLSGHSAYVCWRSGTCGHHGALLDCMSCIQG